MLLRIHSFIHLLILHQMFVECLFDVRHYPRSWGYGSENKKGATRTLHLGADILLLHPNQQACHMILHCGEMALFI